MLEREKLQAENKAVGEKILKMAEKEQKDQSKQGMHELVQELTIQLRKNNQDDGC